MNVSPDKGVVSDNTAVCASHTDASAFCVWLSKIDGRPFMLPSSQEWEYAFRSVSAPRLSRSSEWEWCRDDATWSLGDHVYDYRVVRKSPEESGSLPHDSREEGIGFRILTRHAEAPHASQMGIRFIKIVGGTFTPHPGPKNGEPQDVTVEDFFISTSVVTTAQFWEFVRQNQGAYGNEDVVALGLVDPSIRLPELVPDDVTQGVLRIVKRYVSPQAVDLPVFCTPCPLEPGTRVYHSYAKPIRVPDDGQYYYVWIDLIPPHTGVMWAHPVHVLLVPAMADGQDHAIDWTNVEHKLVSREMQEGGPPAIPGVGFQVYYIPPTGPVGMNYCISRYFQEHWHEE